MVSILRKKNRQRRIYPYSILVLLLLFAFFAFLVWNWHLFFRENSTLVPAEGGILTEATVGTTLNFNPLSSRATVFDKSLHKLLYAGLLEYNPITTQIGDGMASFRVSDDGLEYFVTLKDSARFSNGKAVTADDVLFTYDSLIKNIGFRNSQLAEKFEYVEIQKLDEQNLVFVLPEPNAYFTSALTTPILYADSYKNALIEEILDPGLPANKRPVSSGPYVLENIVPEEDGSFRVFLRRNRFYFKKSPYIQRFVFYIYPEFSQLEFNHQWPTFFSFVPFGDLENFQKKLFGEYQRREYLLPRFLSVFFNLDAGITARRPLRKAIELGTEKERLFDKNPGWEKIDSLFFFEGVESWQEADFREGRQLLQNNGFRYNETEAVRFYNEKPAVLRFVTSTAPPVYSRFAQLLAQRWEDEYNFDVDVQVLDPDEFEQALENRDYDLLLFGQDYSENSHSLATWHSSQSGELNLSNLTNEDIDFLINEIYLTGAQGQLFELGQKLTEIMPAIPLATPRYHVLVSSDLRGFSDSFGKLRHHSDRFYGIEDWYFLEKRKWSLPSDSYKLWEFVKFLFTGSNAKNY